MPSFSAISGVEVLSAIDIEEDTLRFIFPLKQ